MTDKKRGRGNVYYSNLKKVFCNPKIANLFPSPLQLSKIKRRSRLVMSPLKVDIKSELCRSKSSSNKEKACIQNQTYHRKNTLISELRKFKIQKKIDSQVIDTELLNKYVQKKSTIRPINPHYAKPEQNTTKKWLINQNYKMYLIKKRKSKAP